MAYRTITVPANGGLNSSDDPSQLQPNESPTLKNVHFSKRTCKKRNGSRKLTKQPVPMGGLRFDGVSGWVRIPSSTAFDISGDMTVEFVIRFNALPGASATYPIINHGGNNVTEESFQIYANANAGNTAMRLLLEWKTTGGTNRAHTPATFDLAAGVRYHVSWAYDAVSGDTLRSRLRILNLDSTIDSPTVVLNSEPSIASDESRQDANGIPILIGAFPQSDNGVVDYDAGSPTHIPANYIIDEVRIWNARLTTTDTDAYCNRELDSQHTFKSNLRGYWKMNDRNGTAVTDSVLTINTSGTPAAGTNGRLYPVSPNLIDGLQANGAGRAIRLDGYQQSLRCAVGNVIPQFIRAGDATAPDTTVTVNNAYVQHFTNDGVGVEVRPVWCFEMMFRFPTGATVASRRLVSWRFESTGIGPDIILDIRTTSGSVIQIQAGATATGTASDETLSVTGTTTIVAGTTYHVAANRTLSSGGTCTLTLFVNGLSEGTPDASAANVVFGPSPALADFYVTPIFIGWDESTTYSQIDVDEIRLWSNAQSATVDADARDGDEIFRYFNTELPAKERYITTDGSNPVGTGQKLINYWKCDDNWRDYSDAKDTPTDNADLGYDTEGIYPSLALADSGGFQYAIDHGVATAPPGPYTTPLDLVVGGCPAFCDPGTHIPEWTAGLIIKQVRGGCIDGVKTFKKTDNTQELLIVAEGDLYKAASTTLPTTLTEIRRSGMQGGRPYSFVTMRDRIYMTNGYAVPRAYDGTVIRNWGIQGPTCTPNVIYDTTAGTIADGDVQYVYTYVSKRYGIESNPSPPSVVFRSLASVGVGLRVHLFHSPDTQVDTIRLYRTTHGATTGDPQPGSSDYFLVDEMDNDVLAADFDQDSPTDGIQANEQAFRTYVDTVGDARLGVAADSRQGFTVNGPAPWCQYAAFFNGRVFLANDPRNEEESSRLFYSESLKPESFGALNFIDVESGEGEPITGLKALFDRLFIFKRSSMYALSGTGPSNFSVQLITPNTGTYSGHSIVEVDGVLYFLSDRGPMAFNGVSFDWIGKNIQETFEDFGKADFSLAVAGHNKDQDQIWFSCKASSSSTSNDRILVWDITHRVWSLYTGLYPQSMDSSIDSTGTNRLLFGDDFGFVWIADNDGSFQDGDVGFYTGSPVYKTTVASGSTARVINTAGSIYSQGTTGLDDGRLKGLRVEIDLAAGTAEKRIVWNTSTSLTVETDGTESGFSTTPAVGEAIRIAAVDAQWTGPPHALAEVGNLARTEEVEVEGVAYTDNNANGTDNVSTVALIVGRAKDYSTSFTEETKTVTVGQSSSGASASFFERANQVERCKRYQIRFVNDRVHEGFEIRNYSVRFIPYERF